MALSLWDKGRELHLKHGNHTEAIREEMEEVR
jgi:hypothetical protein